MRSPFAYVPRPRPLQQASPGAAVAYLGALAVVAFLYSSPLVLAAAGAAVVAAGLLAGARTAVRAGVRMGLSLALLIVAVNALVVSRGETVLARLGDWPLLGRVDVTAESLVAGLSIGLRAAVVMVAAAVYSACVDPDRVLRALRPLAGRSALTATLVSRLVPVAAADAGRLRDAARLRGPGAAASSWPPLLRRLLAGSFDRAVDVAATLELRGYSTAPRRRGGGPRPSRQWLSAAPRWSRQRRAAAPRWSRQRRAAEPRSRYDWRFYLVALALLAAAVAGEALGADDFRTYPAIEVGLGPATLALSALVAASGLAPLRRKPRRRPAPLPNPRHPAAPPPALQPKPRNPAAPLFLSGAMHRKGTAEGEGGSKGTAEPGGAPGGGSGAGAPGPTGTPGREGARRSVLRGPGAAPRPGVRGA